MLLKSSHKRFKLSGKSGKNLSGSQKQSDDEPSIDQQPKTHRESSTLPKQICRKQAEFQKSSENLMKTTSVTPSKKLDQKVPIKESSFTSKKRDNSKDNSSLSLTRLGISKSITGLDEIQI